METSLAYNATFDAYCSCVGNGFAPTAPFFEILKAPNGVRCLRLIFPHERDACKTKAGACSRHGDACATFFGTSAMPAKHKQMPAADMAMPAPQLFQYTRDACKTKAGACSRHGDARAPIFSIHARCRSTVFTMLLFKSLKEMGVYQTAFWTV